jgi:hypothetical protein
LHVRSIDSARLCGVQLTLNPDGIGAFIRNREILRLPIAQNHRQRRGAATVFLLMNERDIQPQTRRTLRGDRATDQEERCGKNELSLG